jgi:hypothetical protein
MDRGVPKPIFRDRPQRRVGRHHRDKSRGQRDIPFGAHGRQGQQRGGAANACDDQLVSMHIIFLCLLVSR